MRHYPRKMCFPIFEFPSGLKLIVKQATCLQFVFLDNVIDRLSLVESKCALVISSEEVERVTISVAISARVTLDKATSREQPIQFKSLIIMKRELFDGNL